MTTTLFLLFAAILLIQTSDASSAAGRISAFCSPSGNSSAGGRRSRLLLPAAIYDRAPPPLHAEKRDDGEEDGGGTDGGGGGTWNPLSLAVLKLGFTEPAWTSPLNYKDAEGTYSCAGCSAPLFSSKAKYDSGSGWPSFWRTAASDRVSLEKDWGGRIEARCAGCKGHLGHVFPDGPARGTLEAEQLGTVPGTDPQIGYKAAVTESYKARKGDASAEESEFSRMPRFCMNGMALRFKEEDQ